jgi:prepilin-type N-terminal cleavage/methylation domain-containing protein
MSERGHTLVEMVIVVAILVIFGTLAVPHIRAYSEEVHLLGGGHVFRGEFRKARSMAATRGVYTALRFESQAGGGWNLSTYADGNHNGVLSSDIAAGIDRRVAGPRRLTTGAGDVRVGINPGTPEIPPERGTLDPADPIRFGQSNMLSFSPLGTATPGTFYLAGAHAQAAVRVTPGTARVRLMVCRGGRWIQR